MPARRLGECTWHLECLRCKVCGNDRIGHGEVFLDHEAGVVMCNDCHKATFLTCRGCKGTIHGGDSTAFVSQGSCAGTWHTRCFSCARCRREIDADEAFMVVNGGPCCSNCYAVRFYTIWVRDTLVCSVAMLVILRGKRAFIDGQLPCGVLA